MRFNKILFVAIATFLLAYFALPVMAQEPTQVDLSNLLGIELPDTATGAVELVAALIISLFGGASLAQWLTDVVKRIDLMVQKWTKRELWDDETETRIGGHLAALTALLISTGVYFLAQNWLTPFAKYLDQMGIWPIVLSIWGLARLFNAALKNKGAHRFGAIKLSAPKFD